MAPPETDNIGARTLQGMAWAYGSYVGGRLLVLLSTAILARLLTPEDFGLVALAIVMMALLDGVADLGLGSALVIQKAEHVYERAETVFVGSVTIGLALSLAIVAVSPVAASFFDEPALVGIASALGANFFLRSLGVTHYALAQKQLNFRARTVAEFADATLRGLVGIVLALAGFGAWSLIIGYLVGTVTRDIAIWAQIPWRPRLRPKRAHLRPLIRFGGTLSAVDIISSLISNLDYVLIGRVLGSTSLGLYTLGFRLPELLISNLSNVAGDVLFPAFSAIDRASIGRAFLISLRYTAMIALPLAIALAILAEPLILTAFGDQWRGSIETMRIVALYSLAVSLTIPAGTMYKATGRPELLLAIAVLWLTVVAIGLVLFVDQGIAAAAAVQASAAGLAAVCGIGLASRLLGVSLGEIWRALVPPVAGGVATAPALLAIALLVESPIIAVVLAAIVGPGIYLGTIALLAPETLRYLRDRMRRASGEVEPTGEPQLPGTKSRPDLIS